MQVTRTPWQLGQLADLKPNSVTYCRQPWKAKTTPLGFCAVGIVVTISLSMNTWRAQWPGGLHLADIRKLGRDLCAYCLLRRAAH